MEKKVLILKRKTNSLFFTEIDEEEQYCRNYFENRFLRKIITSKSPFFSIYFGKWKRNIDKYDLVILFDQGYDKGIVKYIKEKNPKAKIIFWYWNSLWEFKNCVVKNDDIDEIWTYNRFDAEKYHLHYNPQFYSKKMKLPKNKIQYDILFLGRNKGRAEAIEELRKKFEANGLLCHFKIIKHEKEYMSYKKYLKDVSKSKCIFDFSNDIYSGLTLRPLEALFFKKKLITNNKDIVNYDFYHPDNIFVLGIDNEDKIKEFLDCPYKEISQDIIDYYDYESWKNRFE